jgi:hypothetical protein
MNRSRTRNAQAIVLTLATFAFGYSFFVLLKARRSISDVAGDRPYCVQISTDEGYRRLTASWQLAGFRMRGTDGRFHAVLVVGSPQSPVLYHWSYFKSAFVEHGYSNVMRLFCDPRTSFLTEVDSGTVGIARAGEFWRYGYEVSVPDAYSPTADTADWRLFSILARAPDFEPGGSARCPVVPCSYVGVSVAHGEELEMWRRRNSAEDRIESLGIDRGLLKERVWPAGKRAGGSPGIQYYALDANGRTTTLIACFEGDQYQCTHVFTDGELSYSFHHMPSELNRWQAMQARLVEKVATFIVHRPTQVPTRHSR